MFVLDSLFVKYMEIFCIVENYWFFICYFWEIVNRLCNINIIIDYFVGICDFLGLFFYKINNRIFLNYILIIYLEDYKYKFKVNSVNVNKLLIFI